MHTLLFLRTWRCSQCSSRKTPLKPRTDLAPEVAQWLSTIWSWLSVERVALRIWDEVLSSEDRNRLGDYPLPRLLWDYAGLRGCSLERADPEWSTNYPPILN